MLGFPRLTSGAPGRGRLSSGSYESQHLHRFLHQAWLQIRTRRRRARQFPPRARGWECAHKTDAERRRLPHRHRRSRVRRLCRYPLTKEMVLGVRRQVIAAMMPQWETELGLAPLQPLRFNNHRVLDRLQHSLLAGMAIRLRHPRAGVRHQVCRASTVAMMH